MDETGNEPVAVEVRDTGFEATDAQHALMHLEQI
jgi:hypothetical protein